MMLTPKTPREAGEAAFYADEGNIPSCLKAAFDAYEAASGWLPIETAPKDGTAIVGWCVHEDDPYFLENGNLTTYGAHAEGISRVQDGPHVLVWGGQYDDYDEWSQKTVYVPDWWFRLGSEFEEAANPTHWHPLPAPPALSTSKEG